MLHVSDYNDYNVAAILDVEDGELSAATSPDFTGMEWGYKFVGADLSTSDHQGGRFRYRLGEWHHATDIDRANREACPSVPGDGLCVARSLSAAQAGGNRLGRSVMLLVGFRPDDVVGGNSLKLRVSRLWVAPDPLDPVAILATKSANLRWEDLSDADLRGVDLHGADLREAHLREASLHDADLHGADLRDAHLHGADLRGADLRGADLRGASLYGANLRWASLNDADLRGADLSEASLPWADLRGADLRGAVADRWTRWPDGFDARAAGVLGLPEDGDQ